MQTRRNCASCRLAKCLLMGMSPDLIRKEEKQTRKYSSLSKSSLTKFTVAKQVTVRMRVE